MKMKKILAVLLVGGMAAGLLAGCGSSASSEEEAVVADEAADAADGSSDAELSAEEEEEEWDEEDYSEIQLYALSLFGTDGVEDVQNAVNEIAGPKAGVQVTLNVMDMAAYAEQTSLMFSSQEEMDIMMTTPIQSAGFSSLVSQNELLPLNDYLDDELADTAAILGDLLDGTTVNGNVYSLTTYRTLNSNCYAILRKDILDDLGLTEDAENLNNWTDLKAIYQAVLDSDYDGGKVTTCIANNDNDGTVISVEYAYVGEENWADNRGYDTLGDTYKIISVNEDTDTVESYFESEDYYKMLKIMTDMYNAGYVYKDASTSDDSGDTLITNDVTFSTVVNSEIGIEANRLSTTGYEVVCPMLTSEPLSTGSATKFSWAIPITAKDPEAAARFLNLMYTNADIENLLVWGIEGRDYEVVDGEASKLDSVVYQSNDFLWGNQFLAYPAVGQGADFREVAKASMDEATISKYFGCTVDTAEISNTLTAVYNVIEQYKPGLESGSTPVADTYEEYLESDFVKDLQAAGIQDVLDEYQAQLDAWLAEQ